MKLIFLSKFHLQNKLMLQELQQRCGSYLLRCWCWVGSQQTFHKMYPSKMNHRKLEEFCDQRQVMVQGHIEGSQYESNCNTFPSFKYTFEIIHGNKPE